MATRFLELGATVYICGRREEVSRKLAELSPKGPHPRISLRRAQTRSRRSMIDSIWIDGPLDILVNNAAGNFSPAPKIFLLAPGNPSSTSSSWARSTAPWPADAAGSSPRTRNRPQHLGHIRARRLGLRGSLRRLQGWSRSSHPQPCRRMGQSRHSHERHRPGLDARPLTAGELRPFIDAGLVLAESEDFDDDSSPGPRSAGCGRCSPGRDASRTRPRGGPSAVSP